MSTPRSSSWLADIPGLVLTSLPAVATIRKRAAISRTGLPEHRDGTDRHRPVASVSAVLGAEWVW